MKKILAILLSYLLSSFVCIIVLCLFQFLAQLMKLPSPQKTKTLINVFWDSITNYKSLSLISLFASILLALFIFFWTLKFLSTRFKLDIEVVPAWFYLSCIGFFVLACLIFLPNEAAEAVSTYASLTTTSFLILFSVITNGSKNSAKSPKVFKLKENDNSMSVSASTVPDLETQLRTKTEIINKQIQDYNVEKEELISAIAKIKAQDYPNKY
ncbi:hypothetical protein SOP56_09675 [Weissella confusa]|uniref:hypothetical protein n=1 Tax=Weissella confusa TaxID=1583 RepID=UPI002A75AF9A|nr:hypothetical protein [Weissella confusa]MDY2530106.1 hypothetical protein [Weissella confusa]